ncbi:MAG: acyl-CoA dehydrogenase family protein [Oryzihumus sp.]
MTDLTPLGAALRAALDGRWAQVRQEARERFTPEDLLTDPTLDQEAHRARVFEQMRLLAGTGHPRNGFPVEFGGRNDVGASVTAFEMLAHGDLSLLVKAGVHWGLFGGALVNLGTREHHERYLEDVISFALPGCFAMTEVGHGSDVQHLHTTATYDPGTGEFVVDTPHEGAVKTYIGGAARDGRLAVVFAQLVTGGRSHGVHALLVPIRDEAGRACPGVAIGDCGAKAGLAGVDNGTLAFDHVRVPRTALLNRFGDVAGDGTYSSPIENESRRFFTMLGTLVRGRVSVAGAAGSATKTALAIAIRYAAQRSQFAAPGSEEEVLLLDYRTHQRKLLPALATSYALQFAQNELVASLHEVQTAVEPDEVAQRELESRVAGIKAVVTWHATSTIQTCREACGGAGYLAENRLPALKADTDVFTTFEGDNTVLLQLVAKGLLTGYRDTFGDLDTLGMVRYAAGQIAASVIERTATRPLLERIGGAGPRTGDTDLRDRALHLRLFEDREKHVLEGLARRLRRAGAPDADAFAVFNAAQDHVLRAARAYVDRVVLKAFVAGIEACTDPAARETLSRVCDLYALSTIEQDKAWFLEHGRLTPSRAKAVTAAVNALCAELRPDALALVEGFGIPAEWLGAPIAVQPAGGARQREATVAQRA